VEADEKRFSFLEKKRVALNTMNDFVTWMKKNTEYKAKTTRTYAGAVQALVKYLVPGAKVSTSYADFSGFGEARRQYPWTVQTVSVFADAMNDPLYRCLVAVFFQSGISMSHVLALTYGARAMVCRECIPVRLPLFFGHSHSLLVLSGLLVQSIASNHIEQASGLFCALSASEESIVTLGISQNYAVVGTVSQEKFCRFRALWMQLSQADCASESKPQFLEYR